MFLQRSIRPYEYSLWENVEFFVLKVARLSHSLCFKAFEFIHSVLNVLRLFVLPCAELVYEDL
jgi:hypothetical protein